MYTCNYRYNLAAEWLVGRPDGCMACRVGGWPAAASLGDGRLGEYVYIYIYIYIYDVYDYICLYIYTYDYGMRVQGGCTARSAQRVPLARAWLKLMFTRRRSILVKG